MTTAVAKIETARPPKPALTTGNAVAAMVPNSIESAWRLSEVIAASGMAPKTYGQDPNKIMVGMLAGLEIGLTPFAALQSIAVINGNPSLWGDGALALVLASNLVDDMDEQDDGETATCTIKRTGRATPIVRTFSNADARKAGLSGKAGPWTQYPARMRQMRARAFALRDGFPDVLKGLRVAEEARDYQDFSPATPRAAAGVAVPHLTGAALLEQAEESDATTPEASTHSPAADTPPAGDSEATQDAGAGAASIDQAEEVTPLDRARGFVAGLLHDVGNAQNATDLEALLMRGPTVKGLAKLDQQFPDLWSGTQAAVDARRAQLDAEGGAE